MAKVKRMSILMTLLACLLCFVPPETMAAETMLPLEKGSLTIVYTDHGLPLTGVEFDIFQITELDENGQWKRTAPYKQYPVTVTPENTEDWHGAALALQGYILRDGLQGEKKGRTGTDGSLVFPDLNQGLYLVTGQRHITEDYVYECTPFFVVLPSVDVATGDSQYDLTAEPKKEKNTAPEDGEGNTVSRKVIKVWSDKDAQNHPEQVVVDLLRDGEIYNTVKLNQENQWRHTWGALPADSSWSVTEREIEHYQVKIAREGSLYVITNTSTEKEEPDDNGKKTDDSGTTEEILPWTGQPWVLVAGLCALGLLLIVLGLLCKRGDVNES